MAQRLAAKIESLEKRKVPVGILDINLYRDDLSTVGAKPVLNATDIPFEGKRILDADQLGQVGKIPRDLIEALYKPDWKAWLGDTGDGRRDGGPRDPRIVLILVETDSVVYSKNDRPMPLALFQVVRGMITGEPPKVANLRELDANELRREINPTREP